MPDSIVPSGAGGLKKKVAPTLAGPAKRAPGRTTLDPPASDGLSLGVERTGAARIDAERVQTALQPHRACGRLRAAGVVEFVAAFGCI